MSISEEFYEEFYDILISGYGPELTNWHKTELTKLVNPLSDEEKKELYKEYNSDWMNTDDYDVSEEEREFVRELCEVS